MNQNSGDRVCLGRQLVAVVVAAAAAAQAGDVAAAENCRCDSSATLYYAAQSGQWQLETIKTR